MSGQVRKRLIVGISGASGTVLGVRLLQVLHGTDVETHLVLTATGEKVAKLEMGLDRHSIEGMADVVHADDDFAAAIASGSFGTMGMVVVPCSMRSLAGIANSLNSSLLIRSADVCLKERRRLVLVVRETPLRLAHLRLMASATEDGAVVLPPVVAFYHQPISVDQIVDQIVGKVLDQFDVPNDLFRRWEGSKLAQNATLCSPTCCAR